MKPWRSSTTAALLFLAFVVVEGFSLPAPASRPKSGMAIRATDVPSAPKKTHVLFMEDSIRGGAESSNRNLPKFVYRLNSSTKWLVTVANTYGIWSRVPNSDGPFIVVGAIAATYLTEILKEWLNHDRPEGAPFTDPGMPSSHSLVSCFMAAGWGTLVIGRGVGVPLVWTGATAVALLRVVCGYHSWAQIGVGAALGSGTGTMWAKLGRLLHETNPRTMQRVSWGLYLAGSALFIAHKMRDWVTKEKHL